tara:strand:- start:403 stop:636 length:234 start_codon:yes stop_codon:yes gene_type:complete
MLLTNETKRNFCNDVEIYVKNNGGLYIDAVIEMTETYNISPEIIGKHLSKPIIEKIGMEGMEINLLPKTENVLPFLS